MITARSTGSSPPSTNAFLTFATPQALAAFDASATPGFAVASVGVVDDSYRLLLAPSVALLAAVDGVNVVAPAGPAGAVWVRLYERNLAAQYVSTWFVDVTAGDDRNDGTTSLTSLKTLGELSTRLHRATIPQSTTVSLAAGTYGDLHLDLTIGVGIVFTVQGAVTTSAPGVFTTVTASVPPTNTRGLVADTTTPTTFVVGERLRVTSGAVLGALAYVTRIPAANQANVSRWTLFNPSTGGTASFTAPSVADTFVVDTLTVSMGRLDLRCRGIGRIVVRDVTTLGSNTSAHRLVQDLESQSGMVIYGCIQSGAQDFFASTFNMVSCRNISALNVAVGSGARMQGQVSTSSIMCGSSTSLQVLGCQMVNTQFLVNQGYLIASADLSWVDCTTDSGLLVDQLGHVVSSSSTNILWGANNAFVTAALRTESASQMTYVAKPVVPGAPVGQDVDVGGTLAAYAALPIVNAANSAAIVLEA